jgi:hypothetical protein
VASLDPRFLALLKHFSVGFHQLHHRRHAILSRPRRLASLALSLESRQVGRRGVLCLLAYFAHLSTFGLLGVSVTVIAAFHFPRRESNPYRQLATDLSPLLWPALAFIALPVPRSAGPVQWNTLQGKLVIGGTLLRTYSASFDLVFLGLLAVLAVMAFRATTSIRLNKPLAAAAVGLALALLATPKGAFGGSGLDARYALPSAALALLSLEGAIRRRQALALAVIALLAVRHLAVLRSWSALSPDVAANVTLLKVVSEQSAIAVDFTADDRNRDTEKRTSVLKHVASYATVIRQSVTSDAFTNRNSSGSSGDHAARRPRRPSVRNRDATGSTSFGHSAPRLTQPFVCNRWLSWSQRLGPQKYGAATQRRRHADQCRSGRGERDHAVDVRVRSVLRRAIMARLPSKESRARARRARQGPIESASK